MVYKNGLKEYGIIFGASTVGFGVLMGLFWSDMVRGLISGIVFGVVFTGLMVLFSLALEKKIAPKHAELAETKTIVCDGAANHKKGINAIGGWLFLTTESLEFYPHKLNFGGKNLVISARDITSVSSRMTILTVTTATESYNFVVNKSGAWEASIKNAILKTSI